MLRQSCLIILSLVYIVTFMSHCLACVVYCVVSLAIGWGAPPNLANLQLILARRQP